MNSSIFHLPFSILALFLTTPIFAADFQDPAPPTLTPLGPIASPTPSAQKELTFHAAPGPLPKEAVTVDSPGFMGAAHAPFSAETKLRDDLKDLPIVWETEKGSGYAAPSILGDRLILFHRVKDEEVVECLHPETGQRYWRFAYACEYQDRYGYTNGPRCTPLIDDKTQAVFTMGVEGKLHAIDLKTGQLLWQRDLLAEFKLDANFFGVGSTPLLEKDLLIVNVGAKNACVVAFDTKTGKAKWASPAPKDWGPSYASPVAATVHDLRRLFVFAGGESHPATGGLLCINPADGSVDFSFPWRSRTAESVNASAPLIVNDQVLISECYQKRERNPRPGTALLQLSVEKSKLAFKELWQSEKLNTHFMTALPLDGYLYGCDGHGPDDCPLVCITLASGEEKWRSEPDFSENVNTRSGEKKTLQLSSDRCHLLRVDGKTLCLGEWGHLAWLDLTPAGCKIVSRTWLFAAGETWSPPVISRGLLYINQNARDLLNSKPTRLICYDLRAKG